MLFWEKRPKRDWHLFFEFTRIERDVVPPEDVFKTAPPPGHKAENTKEDAPLGVLGGRYIGDAMPFALLVHIGFVLPDGSVLLAWSSPERSLMDQSSLFEDLQPGGPLPVLPAVITGLEPMPSKSPVRYTGRHLMCTKKNGAVLRVEPLCATADGARSQIIPDVQSADRLQCAKGPVRHAQRRFVAGPSDSFPAGVRQVDSRCDRGSVGQWHCT